MLKLRELIIAIGLMISLMLVNCIAAISQHQHHPSSNKQLTSPDSAENVESDNPDLLKSQQPNNHQPPVQSDKAEDHPDMSTAEKGQDRPGAQENSGMHMDRSMEAPQKEPQKMQGAETEQNAPSGPVLTLLEIEQMALENNPTLVQAEAAIRAAQGRRKQAGLLPNPVIGYRGEEFAFRAFTDKSEHFFFVEQNVPLGGKLAKSRRIFEQEVTQAEIEADAQKQRVLNTVRILYYEVLGAQKMVDLRTELVRNARDAVKTTAELLNVGQADQPDYLEAEIEEQQVEIKLEDAKNNREQIWRILAAAIGAPSMAPARLSVNLEENLPVLNQEAITATLLRESPEIKSAKARLELARAVVERAKAERIPDLFLRGAIGYSREFLETRTGISGRTGPEGSVEVGFTLPILNRNQGGIAAAEAELALAEREVQRLELALRMRMARAFMDYNRALSMVQRYQRNVLPRAQKAYQIYQVKFREMSAAYPQVLIAQRNMFQMQEDYTGALVELWRNAIFIEGFLLADGFNAPRLRPFEIGGGEEMNQEIFRGKQHSNSREERAR